MQFRALVLENDPQFSATVKPITLKRLREEEGEVLVKIDYSTLNYKDALAISNRGIAQRWPMVAGIDFSGVVEEDLSGRFAKGDRVLLNGYGASEHFWGGLAEYAYVRADYLLPIPENLSAWDAMALGTAGYTAALAVQRLLDHGVTPEGGYLLVSGATGGVGSTAIYLLAKMGFKVVALTAKTKEVAFFKRLGAAKVLSAKAYYSAGKPLGSEEWQGAIDVVGSHTLANICAEINYGGIVAACGLAQGADLPGSVLPFILRGVTLAGIDSVMAPMEQREAAWALLDERIDPDQFAPLSTTITLSECVETAEEMLAGKIKGRFVVDVNEE